MRAPGFWWQSPGLIATLLTPVGALYGAVAAARMGRAGERAAVPVICVGNPTLGGAGKTPTALALADLLAALGERPVFITRGYGGSEPGPLRVDRQRHDARAVGDEALLLARTFTTVVARERVAGARLAVQEGASVIVLDDGFQNPALAKASLLKYFDKVPLTVMDSVVKNLQTAFARDGRQNEQMWKNLVLFMSKAKKTTVDLETREGVLWTNKFIDE